MVASESFKPHIVFLMGRLCLCKEGQVWTVFPSLEDEPRRARPTSGWCSPTRYPREANQDCVTQRTGKQEESNIIPPLQECVPVDRAFQMVNE